MSTLKHQRFARKLNRRVMILGRCFWVWSGLSYNSGLPFCCVTSGKLLTLSSPSLPAFKWTGIHLCNVYEAEQRYCRGKGQPTEGAHQIGAVPFVQLTKCFKAVLCPTASTLKMPSEPRLHPPSYSRAALPGSDHLSPPVLSPISLACLSRRCHHTPGSSSGFWEYCVSPDTPRGS